MTSPEVFGARRGLALTILLGVTLYVAWTLGSAIGRTALVEQDAAYYCEVALRYAGGEGLTSLADRRGPAEPAPFPQPLRASTHWPLVLGLLARLTGEAVVTACVVSLAALLASLWLLPLLLQRALLVGPATAVLAACAALLNREALQAAVVPYADSLSLLLNIAFVFALVRRRALPAVALLLAAVVVRHQNLVLLLALPCLWTTRWTAWLGALAVLAPLAIAPATALEGLAVLLNPFHRDSLPRGLRFLTVLLVVGFWLGRRDPRLHPFALLAAGHLCALLLNPDPSDQRPWLFAARHALPLHVAAAAGAVVALSRARTWALLLSGLMLLLALVEHADKPWKIRQLRAEVTERPDLVPMLEHLRRQPLPQGAVVLCHDIDVLALYLKVRGVHLRGHDAVDAAQLRSDLARRGVTHALLTWHYKDVMQGRNEWMRRIEQALAPVAKVLADLPGPHGCRSLLLRLDWDSR